MVGLAETLAEFEALTNHRRGALTTTEQTSYLSAVLCLQSKPSKIASGVVPGAKTRYDDFVAIHINQTLSIHSTVGNIQ